MTDPEPTAGPCEVCDGPVSTFIAYNHENGTQTERILREDWKASVDAHHEYEASLRAEVERMWAERKVVLDLVVYLRTHIDRLNTHPQAVVLLNSAEAALARMEGKV